MENEELIHDWMVSHLKGRLSRDYNDIKMNLGNEQHEYDGHHPDLILGNHGIVLALMEVETASTINEEQAVHWKTLAGLGTKLILMVPRASRARVIDLLWKQGLADKASVGSYELNVSMP